MMATDSPKRSFQLSLVVWGIWEGLNPNLIPIGLLFYVVSMLLVSDL